MQELVVMADSRKDSGPNVAEDSRVHFKQKKRSSCIVEQAGQIKKEPVDITVTNPKTEENLENTDWRSSCKTFSDRMKYMFENLDNINDVTFVVGPCEKEVPCLKFVLQLGSSVLERLINQHEVVNSNQIMLRNFNPKAFQAVVKYLFCDIIDEEALKSPYQLFEIADAAKRLCILPLQTLCLDYLNKSISEETAVSLLHLAEKNQKTEFHEAVFTFILNNAEKICKSHSFENLSISDLKIFITHDDFQAQEITIFKALLRWAEAKCAKGPLKITPENIRVVLHGVHLFVRFPLMSLKCFISEVHPTKILSSKEEEQLLLYLSAQEKQRNHLAVKFSTRPRKPLPIIQYDNIYGEISNDCQKSQDNQVTVSLKSAENRRRKTVTSNLPDESPPKSRPRLSKPTIDQTTQTVLFEKDTDPFMEMLVYNSAPMIINKKIKYRSFLKLCALNPFRESVKKITLENTEIEETLEQIPPVSICYPDLTEFSMDLKVPGLDDDIRNELQQLNLQNYLFFRKAVDKHWSLQDIISSGILIDLRINDNVILKLDKKSREFVINCLSDTSLILENLHHYSYIKCLALSIPCNFSCDCKSFEPESVLKLVLHHAVNTTNVDFFIQKFCKLEKLQILSTKDNTVDFDSCLASKKTLKYLAAGYTVVKNITQTCFPSLEELFLWRCKLDDSSGGGLLHIHFPKLKKVYFYECSMGCSRGKLMQSLKKLQKLTEINLNSCTWKVEIDDAELEVSLNMCGMAVAKTSKNVTLTKKIKTENFWSVKRTKKKEKNILLLKKAVYDAFNFNLFSPARFEDRNEG